MESVEVRIEAKRQKLQRMGEPPSSVAYLLELEFNGERDDRAREVPREGE